MLKLGASFLLKTKFQYKWTSPSHIRHNLTSISVKSCSSRGRSRKSYKIKPQKQISGLKAVRILMYFRLDESLAHSSLNFLLELAMQLRGRRVKSMKCMRNLTDKFVPGITLFT